MHQQHIDLSVTLLLQKEAFEDALKDYSPHEDVRKLLDRHFIQLRQIAEPYYDYGPTPANASVPCTPRPSSTYDSVPHTPTTAFGDDPMSVSSSRFSVSKAELSSTSRTARPELNSYFGPAANLDLSPSSASTSIASTVLHMNGPLGNITNSNGRIKSSNEVEKSPVTQLERGIENFSQPTFAKLGAALLGQKSLTSTLNQQAIRKRRILSESDSSDKEIGMFVAADDHVSSPRRSIENDRIEETWGFLSPEKYGDPCNQGHPKGGSKARKIKQEVRPKAGIARPVSKTTEVDKEEKKIISHFRAWTENENLRKRSVASVNPVEIFRCLRKQIYGPVNEDEQSNQTAAQVTSMILSLGSTEAVFRLKSIIKDMRHVSQALMVVPEVKKKTTGEPYAMGNLIELAGWFFKDQNKGTELEKFQSRHYITNFCRYMVSERNDQMKKKRGLNPDDVDRKTYAELIRKLFPKIPRYRPRASTADTTRSSTTETREFRELVQELKEKSESGFNWLELQEEFGIGILALYHPSKKFSKNARISMDDHDLSEEELNLLYGYLFSKDGHVHNMWLTTLCNLINNHIEQGSKGMLRLPELLLERREEDEILALEEQSWKLANMCRTFEAVERRGMEREEWDTVRGERFRTR